MLWLPLVFLTSFGFGQLFKWSQRRGCYAPAVVSTNYLVLATCLLVYYLATGGLELSRPALILGLYTGIAFICSMLIMTWALEKVAVATVLTAFRLAILVPVLASIGLWDEHIGWGQLAGIGLALASLVLMTWSRSGNGRLLGAAGLTLTLLVFLLQGISHTCMRWIHYAGLDQQRQHVLLVTAVTAGILGTLFVLAKGRRPNPKDLAMGAGIGLFNLMALTILLTALTQVKGTVFFPLQGCAVVILDNLCAHFIWRESLSRRAAIGALLGALAMLLIV